MQTKTSVVIPAFNAERDLPDLLIALGRQLLENGVAEVLVVDDGSTDGTARVAEQYDARVAPQDNAGSARARNRGIRLSRGEIVVFIDSDCTPDDRWLENMLEPFGDDGVVGVQGTYRTRQRGLVARFAQLEIEERYRRMKRRPFIDFIGTYSAAYRKDALLEVGLFDESFPVASGEDTDLSYRMSTAGKKMVLAERAVVYHRHPNSLSRYFKQKLGRGYWRVRLYRKSPRKAVRDDFTPQYLKVQVVLAGLALAGATLLPIHPWFSLVVIPGSLGAIWISAFPSTIRAMRRDPAASALVPFLHVVRALALFLGFGLGLVRELLSPSVGFHK